MLSCSLKIGTTMLTDFSFMLQTGVFSSFFKMMRLHFNFNPGEFRE